MSMKLLRGFLLVAATAVLAGCNTVLMSPSGDVAHQQRNLIINSLVLMLIIIVPVIVLTLVFAWRYRANNNAKYTPEWNHSVILELLIWSAPLLIIIALGAITWVSTHKLDPYRNLDRIAPGRPVTADTKPLEIDVVALDWKWLFIYPEQGIATVNDVAAPVDRPVSFRLTASTMMNSFFIPAMAGQIYAMPGMETKLHAVMNRPGDFSGFSSNYSGEGFSGMYFTLHSLDDSGFDAWVAKAKSAGQRLDRDSYLSLAKPSTYVPVQRYGSVAHGLFGQIVTRCVISEQACKGSAMGGMGAMDEKSAQAMPMMSPSAH